VDSRPSRGRYASPWNLRTPSPEPNSNRCALHAKFQLALAGFRKCGSKITGPRKAASGTVTDGVSWWGGQRQSAERTGHSFRKLSTFCSMRLAAARPTHEHTVSHGSGCAFLGPVIFDPHFRNPANASWNFACSATSLEFGSGLAYVGSKARISSA